MITPAPKNPMPVTSPCTTRLVASELWPVLSKAISVTRAVPRDTKACVRTPAGFRRKLRLMPSALPTSTANPRRPAICQKANCNPKSIARHPYRRQTRVASNMPCECEQTDGVPGSPEDHTVLRRGYFDLPYTSLILDYLQG